jgi:mannan endo-1,4-beta-mannosidase
MKVVGNKLFDASGKQFIARGIEGLFGPNAQANMTTLIDGIASQGFNSIRLQMLTNDLTKIEAYIQRCYAKGMVVHANADNMPGGGQSWFGKPEVIAMLNRNKRNMIIDASIEDEPDADNGAAVVTKWVADTKALITQFRNWGYTQPLVIGTLNSGRYLRGLLDHGQEFVDHDPLHSLVLGCQMYWGNYSGGFSYQSSNKFSAGDAGIKEAIAAIAAKPFLIQLGLDNADSGGNWAKVPLELQMTECQSKGIGYLYWQWKDPGSNDPNSLVTDQLNPNSLTPLGDLVINTHPASIKKTSVKFT